MSFDDFPQKFLLMSRMNRSGGAAVRGGLTGLASDPVVGKSPTQGDHLNSAVSALYSSISHHRTAPSTLSTLPPLFG